MGTLGILRDSKKGMIGILGIPKRESEKGKNRNPIGIHSVGIPKAFIRSLGILRDSKKGTIGTLGIPLRDS